MQNVRFLQLGWLVAIALIGVLVGAGFQDSTSKIGVVDISKVVEGSDFGKENQDSFATMKKQPRPTVAGTLSARLSRPRKL